jgi:hypothetical protein
MMIRRRARAVVVTLAVATLLGGARPVLAAGDTGTEIAASHFRHGVALYKDGDYEAALVEFKRAQEVSPNYRVLYDIGQSLYQLQRYAEALKAFEDYLAQGGTQLSPTRRADVEADLRALHARVGYLNVVVNVEGAEIRVDDQVVGTSPIAAPILVSVGHRKISVARPDRVAMERFVDVAVGDRTKIVFDLPAPVVAAPAPAPGPLPAQVEPSLLATPAAPAGSPGPGSASSSSLAWVPWAATGLFAVGTAVTGALALTSNASLTSDFAVPDNGSAINRDRSRGQALGYASDVFLGATAVALGVAVYVTLRPHGARVGRGGVRLRLGLDGVRFQGDF